MTALTDEQERRVAEIVANFRPEFSDVTQPCVVDAVIAALSDPILIAEIRNEWIPVGERLPEVGVSVLVYEPNRHIQKTCRDNYDWILPHKSNVTHWQPLPNPPSEG